MILEALTNQPQNKRYGCAVCPKEWGSHAARSRHESAIHPQEWASSLRAVRRKESTDDGFRRYKEAHPELVLEHQRRWREEHRDHIKAYTYRRRLTQRERLVAESRAYRQTEAGRAAKARSNATELATGAGLARQAVRSAVQRGTLRRLPCETCGAQEVQAHHHLGYAPEHRLDVQWLCRDHHEAAHHGTPQ